MNQALNAARQIRQDKAQEQPTSGGGQGQTAVAAKPDPARNLLEKLKPQLMTCLPKALDAERVTRVALTELRRNDKLCQAALSNPLSFASAMLGAATLGFEIGNGLGHAYLVPYDKRKKEGNQWVTVATEIQLIIGYRGMIELARRSGQIESIYAVEVYNGEPFEVELGLSQNISHKRRFDIIANPENVIAVYAVAKLKGGEVQFDVMTRSQVDAIRGRSKSKDNGPWVTDWVEMAKKTVVRRLFKYLPVSIEVKSDKDKAFVPLSQLAEDGAVTIDAATGEILVPQNDETPSTSTQDVPPVQSAPETGLGTGGDPMKWISMMQHCENIAELDEVFVRAEGDVSGAQLEAVNRAYRSRKAEIGSLI